MAAGPIPYVVRRSGYPSHREIPVVGDRHQRLLEIRTCRDVLEGWADLESFALGRATGLVTAREDTQKNQSVGFINVSSPCHDEIAVRGARYSRIMPLTHIERRAERRCRLPALCPSRGRATGQ